MKNVARKPEGKAFCSAAEVMSVYLPKAQPSRMTGEPDVAAVVDEMVAKLVASVGQRRATKLRVQEKP